MKNTEGKTENRIVKYDPSVNYTSFQIKVRMQKYYPLANKNKIQDKKINWQNTKKNFRKKKKKKKKKKLK